VPRRLPAALVAALVAAVIGGTAADAIPPPGGRVPDKAVTLARGELWGMPWKVVAFTTKDGFACETLIRGGAVNVCSNIAPLFDPVLSPASWNEHGGMPTTIAVIGASAETAKVRMKLVPGAHVITRRVRPLGDRGTRLAGLPEGFRYTVVAFPKVRGFRMIRAFDVDGRLLGQTPGFPAPPDPGPLPEG
jgi:hypothetical protein